MKKEKNNDEKRNYSSPYLFRYIFPKVWRAAPATTLILFAISIFMSLSTGLSTLINEKLFAGATTFAGGGAITGVIVALSISVGLDLLNRGLGLINYYLDLRYEKKVSLSFTEAFLRKVGQAEPVAFTDTARLDEINKAEEGQESASYFPFQVTYIFTYYIPYFIFMSIYLWRLYPPLVLSLILVFVPAFLGNILKKKISTDLEETIAPYRRAFGYFESSIVGRDLYKENRILGNYHYLRDRHLKTLKAMQKPQKQQFMKEKRLDLTINMCSYVGYTAVLLLLFYALLWGHINVAAFSAVFLSIGNLYGLMSGLIKDQLGSMAEDNGMLSNYVRFMQRKSVRKNNPAPTEPTEITFSDVSFQYPEATSEALKHISFTLKKGETLAIVGENGAGKSTLVRLLLGLYLPKQGKVSYGDCDTTECSLCDLARNSSAVFQSYQKYQLTLRENVTISDYEKTMTDEEMHALLVQSGLDENNEEYPNGLDTVLSREFDGVDVSGGQWQRIAIARGYFRRHWLIVLDEPTAAIDPFEESRIYHRFAEIAKDKSAIIVTHRLGSVRLADRILVLKDGKLVQIGTHDELVHESGEYKRLWDAQSQWYQRENKTTV